VWPVAGALLGIGMVLWFEIRPAKATFNTVGISGFAGSAKILELLMASCLRKGLL